MKNVHVPHIEFPGCNCVNCLTVRIQRYRRSAGVDILSVVGCYGLVLFIGICFGALL